jgi:dynein heavy chain, axonemal
MIWDKCRYFQNNDRICTLLKKISNEIIKRCIASINVKDMFEGDVEKCMQQLNDSIFLCNEWFTIFKNFKTIVNEAAAGDTDKEWTFQQNRVFARIDAFRQRCQNMNQICLG